MMNDEWVREKRLSIFCIHHSALVFDRRESLVAGAPAF